jgi:thioredoxin-related protein
VVDALRYRGDAVKNLLAALGAAASLLVPLAALAQVASPYAIDVPSWFVDTFLDLPEDVRDAAKEGKRLMIYFGQDGCPYCKALMQTNFSQPNIVDKTRRHFVALALNIWGDREVTSLDGRVMPEKELARDMSVQFTPTLLFLDEQANVVARLDGYYPPHRFEAALDYVSGHLEGKQSFVSYMREAARDAASGKLHDEPFFMRPPYDLRRQSGAKPLAVVFETPYCAGCDELHREGFARAEVRAELARFDVVRLTLGERAPLVTPQGADTYADDWGRTLNIAYTPSIVLFDAAGKEVIRIEAYLRPFHLSGVLAYVSSGAYREERSFQRFLQARAERMRRDGQPVDLWK